jgi:pyruvate dehydrogenase E2 component (dihydrolipoamide acetyltransferase)
MADKIVMLALSPTMETGTIAQWVKKEGDAISTGDVLCEVETDKATMDYESGVDGTLLKIVLPQGSKAKVGDLIAIAGNPGENIDSLLKGSSSTEEKKIHVTKEKTTSFESNAPVGVSAEEHLPGGVKASPLARVLAKVLGVDLKQVQGSGPGGRIAKEDVEKYKVTPSKPQQAGAKQTMNVVKPIEPDKEVPVSEKRQVIAKRLSESLFTAPHFYLTINVTADSLLKSRQQLNDKSGKKVSFNAFLMKFVAETLRRHPKINSSWKGTTIQYHSSVDIALAVAQDDGLITPVVRNCVSKGIIDIDNELRDLVDRARIGKLLPEEYLNPTFTISNLGSYGVREFTAIINPPASAILAVGEVFKEPYVDDNGSIAIKNSIMMTLSCDHRVIDGAVAAEFARDLKNGLENPIMLLI